MSRTDEYKEEEIDRARKEFLEGGLTNEEADEYIEYDYMTGPTTVYKQVRRYYLILISYNKRDLAKQFLEGAEKYPLDKIHTEEDAHDLCLFMSQYFRGFVIQPDFTHQVLDEMSKEYPRPLKMITCNAKKPYRVWHNQESIQVQWKAWRQGMPTVIGYGNTEKEAVDNLRYRIQPDHDGTLDGLGKSKGSLIGGNMVSAQDMNDNNEAQFES